MADDYGKIITPNGYVYDYETIYEKIKKNIKNFNKLKYKKLKFLGVNPFDLFQLETFLKENEIKNVLELGSGTTSKFLDVLGIKRKSFALESIYFSDLEFEKIDLYESYNLVQDFLNQNNVDFIFIDCEHSIAMADLIYNNILKYVDFRTPIFIHDWFDFGKLTYSEQVFYYDNLFNHYDLHIMSDLPSKYVDKLNNLGTTIDSKCHVPRCCAILTPKEWKM
jgi:hypothetical protein